MLTINNQIHLQTFTYSIGSIERVLYIFKRFSRCLEAGYSHYVRKHKMAGVAGFEPAHADTKNRCLTAWLHPSSQHIVDKGG